MDKSAVGFSYQEKVAKHQSQTGGWGKGCVVCVADRHFLNLMVFRCFLICLDYLFYDL